MIQVYEGRTNNVKEFRYLLQRTADIEGRLSILRNPEASPLGSAATAGSSFLWQKPRRVVGVYVGWRGNSIVGPGIENLSIWDRKLAAETVSIGSVQLLFANLHNFYLRNSCHRRDGTTGEREKGAVGAAGKDCADVRMLVLGHSFGALIAYRSLSQRLISNIVETYQDSPEDDRHHYAYSYGDLVVLVNPAFEGTRFESVATAAASRNFPTPGSVDQYAPAQLPILIVAQSLTDIPTHIFFPAFRDITTLFDSTQGATERDANIETVGWNDRYLTHQLTYQAGTGFPCTAKGRLACEEEWWKQQRSNGYSGFNSDVLQLPEDLVLTKLPATNRQITRRPYDPIWVVQSSKDIIDGHNDVLNLNFIRFVRQMYYTVLREEDCTLIRASGSSKMDASCPQPALNSSPSR